MPWSMLDVERAIQERDNRVNPKPIDDAMIIEAVERRQKSDGATVVSHLLALSGDSVDACRYAVAEAENRGLIRYEVVPSCVEMNATFTCPDNEMRFVNAKPEDGWKTAYHELGIRIARLSVRLTRLENDNTYLADTIHDEEGEQDG